MTAGFTRTPALLRLSDYPAHWAHARPNGDAVVHGAVVTSHGGFERLVQRVAAAMLAAGVRHGDRVAMMATPRLEHLAHFRRDGRQHGAGRRPQPLRWGQTFGRRRRHAHGQRDRLAQPHARRVRRRRDGGHPPPTRTRRSRCRSGRPTTPAPQARCPAPSCPTSADRPTTTTGPTSS